MTDVSTIQHRARLRYRRLTRRRRDPRYQSVMGRFIGAKLLTSNEQMEPNREPMRVQDVLWAGVAEPRLLELLPALLVKRPSLFVDPKALPDDLQQVVASLRRQEVPPPFRDVPGEAVFAWLPKLGHKDKYPSRLKSFRLRRDDTQRLAQLGQELGLSQTDVIRRALQCLADDVLADSME